MSYLLCLNLNHFRIQNKSQGLDKGNENVVDIRSATNSSATDRWTLKSQQNIENKQQLLKPDDWEEMRRR